MKCPLALHIPLFALLAASPVLCLALRAQETPASPAATTTSKSVVFIGNSFTFGAGSAVQKFRAASVTDLNGQGIGGVPALFKAFALQAGRDFSVSVETAGGKNFDYHVQQKADVLGRSWDFVVMHGYSTLDNQKPGDPTRLVSSGKELAALLQKGNPKVDIRLVATWSRADQTYPESGHWHGKPIEQMALDVRAGYDLAAAAIGPAAHSVVPVGEAWNRAFKSGVADPNPYDGITPGQVDLWANDHYHGSSFGYYLSALMIFGDLTGLDPRSLGSDESAARELGFQSEQAAALQRIAFEELSATKDRPPLQTFKTVNK